MGEYINEPLMKLLWGYENRDKRLKKFKEMCLFTASGNLICITPMDDTDRTIGAVLKLMNVIRIDERMTTLDVRLNVAITSNPLKEVQQ